MRGARCKGQGATGKGQGARGKGQGAKGREGIQDMQISSPFFIFFVAMKLTL